LGESEKRKENQVGLRKEFFSLLPKENSGKFSV